MNGAESHSAEAVRDRIREMIENEAGPREILSDDRIVSLSDRGWREHRAPYRRQIPRSPANPLLGGTPPAESRRSSPGRVSLIPPFSKPACVKIDFAGGPAYEPAAFGGGACPEGHESYIASASAQAKHARGYHRDR